MVDDSSPNAKGSQESGSEISDLESVDRENSSDGITVSRRGILGSLGVLGLLVGASGNATAATENPLGESWEGAPGTNLGLLINLQEPGQALKATAGSTSNNKNDIGIKGETYSNKGIGLVGIAPSSSGNPIGLKGRVDSPDGIGLRGVMFANGSGIGAAVEGASLSDDGTAIRGHAQGSGTTYGVLGKVDSSNGYGLYTPDDAKVDGDLEVGGSVNNTLNVDSDLQVTGTKNFVQAVDTTAGTKNVHYTSIEAGEVRTEHTGVAEMEDGHALIELPEHFDMVTTDAEPIAVQVTAHANEKVHPQVVEKSTRYVSVEDFSEGPDDYSFSYTVKGIRDGYVDEEVVRDS